MKFFVVTKLNSFRHENMKKRFMNIGLQNSDLQNSDLQNVFYIDNYYPPNDIIEYFKDEDGTERTVGCLLSHLKAIKTFYDSNEKIGCILEDDVLFRNDFIERIKELENKILSENLELIQLYTMSPLSGNINTRFGIYGTQGYILTRDYALKCLKLYDRPLTIWKDTVTYQTSECVTMYSRGIVLEIPLLIEDNLSYTIDYKSKPNSEALIRDHLYPSLKNGLKNFINCDSDYKIPSYAVVSLYDNYLQRLGAEECYFLIERLETPKNIEENICLCCLYMLSGYYVNYDKAMIYAQKFYELLNFNEEARKYIIQYKQFGLEYLNFFLEPIKKKLLEGKNTNNFNGKCFYNEAKTLLILDNHIKIIKTQGDMCPIKIYVYEKGGKFFYHNIFDNETNNSKEQLIAVYKNNILKLYDETLWEERK